MQANYVQRLRLTFSKGGPARFISHLDLARAMERSLLRARIPVAYSQGFNRRPRMQFAAALPLGISSECELADIWLEEEAEPAEVQRRLAERIAPGIGILSVAEVPLSLPALQTQTTDAVYVATVPDDVDCAALAQRLEELLASDTHLMDRVRGKKRKRFDLRPLVIDLVIREDSSDDSVSIDLHLAQLPNKSGRPDDVLHALGIDAMEARIHRTRLRLQSNLEPVPG